ncbi:hypothetical protein COU37_04045 [Candidatus Micrarchaeota archaeon CG10_big_fil_rev_8_21_14_0_10_45_29]|nr:MAG: hypothetical protein COU37_04045 [Candidatus Micrarchaeota archaeon CG10_big_fil_rev_8_21_14_0_10_45_29]
MSDRPRQLEVMLEEERPNFQTATDTNLENIVMLPTWREVLMDMVAQDKMDPWNIDVVEVTGKYLLKIKEMQMDDLRIPANLILAAAILLRFKSDMINLDEPVQAELDEFFEPVAHSDLPMMELRGRIPPKRRVTLDELLEAVEQVFEEEGKREIKMQERASHPVEIAPLEIKMSEFNIDDEIGIIHERICERLDSAGLVTFSNLLNKKDRQEIVYTLLPVLFLANEGKISLKQDPFFGEIFIRLNNDNTNAKKKVKGVKARGG